MQIRIFNDYVSPTFSEDYKESQEFLILNHVERQKPIVGFLEKLKDIEQYVFNSLNLNKNVAPEKICFLIDSKSGFQSMEKLNRLKIKKVCFFLKGHAIAQLNHILGCYSLNKFDIIVDNNIVLNEIVLKKNDDIEEIHICVKALIKNPDMIGFLRLKGQLKSSFILISEKTSPIEQIAALKYFKQGGFAGLSYSSLRAFKNAEKNAYVRN